VREITPIGATPHLPRLGRTERRGDASVECPECGTILHTANALIRGEIEDGMRYQGLACSDCGKSYTVELTEAPQE
jgi:hypothetical protein